MKSHYNKKKERVVREKRRSAVSKQLYGFKIAVMKFEKIPLSHVCIENRNNL